ncbi:MAG: hypothetical protein HY286_16695 [Planctomycetes bacterium]|nr:hypothetical protein [Planctomycetota bacterium]
MKDAITLAIATLATPVVWLSPELEIRASNAAARRLIARLEDSRRREGCVGRRPEAEMLRFDRVEAKAIREFLGRATDAPHRGIITIKGVRMDLGIAPLLGPQGEWLGWIVDACELTAIEDQTGVVRMDAAVLRLDANGNICEISRGASALLQSLADQLPVAPKRMPGSSFSDVFGVPNSEFKCARGAKNFELGLRERNLIINIAPFANATGRFAGALVTLGLVDRAENSNPLDALEEQTNAIIAAAMEAANAAQSLAAECEPAPESMQVPAEVL